MVGGAEGDVVIVQPEVDLVAWFDAELVSGDIHIEVPRILRRCGGKRVAVLQDGPKGWEGLATLLAPLTCKAPIGAVVPMPTLPFWSMRMRSACEP